MRDYPTTRRERAVLSAEQRAATVHAMLRVLAERGEPMRIPDLAKAAGVTINAASQVAFMGAYFRRSTISVPRPRGRMVDHRTVLSPHPHLAAHYPAWSHQP